MADPIMKIYTLFDKEDVVANQITRVTDGMWINGTGSLTAFFTSSEQSGSTGEYFFDVYHEDPQLSSSAEVQFAVSYGHYAGSGSPSIENSVDYASTVPTRGIYDQYSNFILNKNQDKFIFAGDFESDDVFIITLNRSQFKQKLDAGNWELTLIHSGSTMTFVDDSGEQLDIQTGRGGRVFNIVSGTLVFGTSASIETQASSEPSGGLGLVYPDIGVLAFNPTALSHSLGIIPNTGDSEYYLNHQLLFDAIKSGSSFVARNVEIITSTQYFVRVKNQEYNFSNNPTFYEADTGRISNNSFIGDPKSYITTVGLYNENNELVAVAKLSVPLLKSFERESLLNIELTF